MPGLPRGLLAKAPLRTPQWSPSLDLAPRLGLIGDAARLAKFSVNLARPLAREVGRTILMRAVGLGRRVAAVVEPLADDLMVPFVSLVGGEAARAVDVYAGNFSFAGRLVSANGRSVFALPPPSRRWAEDLHGFVWLKDLAASDTVLARVNAQALIEDWIELAESKSHVPLAHEPPVVAMRLLALIEHAGWVQTDATAEFRQRLMAQVTQHVRLLRVTEGQRRARGRAEIRIAAALVASAVAVPMFRASLNMHRRCLDRGLKEQILTDGGHISRNPSAIVDALSLLIPLRDMLAVIGQPASTAHMNAIDRMLPMLRFFVGPGPRLAHFNGAAPVAGPLLEAVLARTDTQGCAHGNAAHSGYQRIATNGLALIMDCGGTPPMAFSEDAHAGCLAFEFSSGANRFVINCGTPQGARANWKKLARATAAHSTVIVADRSSATFPASKFVSRLIGPVVLPGPTQVDVDRREHGGAVAIVAGHDGYASDFNLIHERTIRVSDKGDQIDGRDRLMPAGDPDMIEKPYVARFHLAPGIETVLLTNGVVMLIAPDGEAWEFHSADCLPVIEESIDFSGVDGPIPTHQIVLSAKAPATSELRWTFLKTRGATTGG